jgi:hypothetical protein
MTIAGQSNRLANSFYPFKKEAKRVFGLGSVLLLIQNKIRLAMKFLLKYPHMTLLLVHSSHGPGSQLPGCPTKTGHTDHLLQVSFCSSCFSSA